MEYSLPLYRQQLTYFPGKPPSYACPALVPLSNPNESIVRELIFQSLKNVCTQRTPFTKHDLRKVYDSLRTLWESLEKCENKLPPKLSVKFDYYEVISPPFLLQYYLNNKTGMFARSAWSGVSWPSILSGASYSNHHVYFKNESFPTRTAQKLFQVILYLA